MCNVIILKTDGGVKMESIFLSGKKELDIYVNPQRQNLLRCMRIAGIPLTPKQLADRIGVSASSVQHHIGKLMEIGVVALSHTEKIHGITAKYYRVLPKEVRIGGFNRDGHREERFALLQSIVSQVFSGFSDYCEKRAAGEAEAGQFGDMLSGVIRLNNEEAGALYTMIRGFLNEHEGGGSQGEAWEYALIAYPVMKDHE